MGESDFNWVIILVVMETAVVIGREEEEGVTHVAAAVGKAPL